MAEPRQRFNILAIGQAGRLQYEAVLQGDLPVQAERLLQHQVELLIARYARACGESKP